MTQEKMIGILGGMGPAATAFCYEQIVAHQSARIDQDHIPTLIYSNTQIPNRTDGIDSGEDTSIKAALVHTAKTLEAAGATVIIMPCNTAHYWANTIEKNIQIPFLNMIDITAECISKKGCHSIGLLATTGTINSKLYNNALSTYNMSLHHPSASNQETVTALINNIKADPSITASDTTTTTLMSLFDVPVDAFILGCTELSYLYKNTQSPLTIDPIKAVVEKAIQFVT